MYVCYTINDTRVEMERRHDFGYKENESFTSYLL